MAFPTMIHRLLCILPTVPQKPAPSPSQLIRKGKARVDINNILESSVNRPQLTASHVKEG